jgi:TPR repeat protein
MRILTFILSLVCLSAFAEVTPGDFFKNRRDQAVMGDADAQYDIGRFYYYKKDPVEAVKWFRMSAEQGYVEAQLILGLYYAEGDGVSKDQAEAVKWYRKAAEQGHAKAQHNLGVCYYYGDGALKDTVEAVKWFRMSAEQGYAPAQYNLGYCYCNGKGVLKDQVEAVKWYRKAAEQGDISAENNLGLCYDEGKGVLKDPVEAYAYYNLAGITLEGARNNRDILEKEMTPSQLEAGQKRSKELLALVEANKKAKSK